MNYSKAMSDYLVNFSFGKGVNWRVPKRAEGITPYLLKRIWERDNTKQKLLWEIGNSGSVTGDCFVKVAYEEPWQDSAGNFHAGRVRILPLNSSYCFPEFHPHDRTRMLRFKLKYRFWGCVDPETEALTKEGWKKVTEVTTQDELLSLNPDSDEIRWEQPEEMHSFDYVGPMHHWKGTGIDALTTPNHRWLVERSHGRAHTYRWEREFSRTEDLTHKVSERLVTGGGTPLAFALTPKWDDELVETVAWYVTEGWDHTNQTGCNSIYLAQKRPEHVATIRRLAAWWKLQGASFNEYAPKQNGIIEWYLGRGVKEALFDAAPGKQITPEFLCSLTASQARLFYETLMDGDGCRTKKVEGRTVNSERWTQLDPGRVDGFQMLCAMLGRRSRFAGEKVTAYQSRHTTTSAMAEEVIDYDGKVYCPTMPSGTWLARRNGTVWWTGNTSLEGTRQVFCVDDKTEALTRQGWKAHADISTDDEVLGIDPATKVVTWQPVLSMHRFDYKGDLVHWKNSHGFDALTTPNHRWLTNHRDRNGYSHWDAPARFMTTEELSGSNKQIITGGGTPQCFATTPVFSDEFVELVGWAVTEGHYQKPPARTGVMVSQSETANPEKTDRIRTLVKHFSDQGATATEQNSNRRGVHAGCRDFYFGKGIGDLIRQAAPDKQLTPEFLGSLTEWQANLLYETLLDGDGHRSVPRDHDGYNRTVSTENFIQKDRGLIDGYQMLAAMLGRRTCRKDATAPGVSNVVTYSRPVTTARHLEDDREHYEGVVWCPKTPTQTWLARRNGGTFWTGNTYTEIITDSAIEEYVNDELIDSRPNPLGEIPVAYCPNLMVSGSPWGLSDLHDVISINREYNEKSTQISDIVSYHASPVTVITGAKASQLEKGAKKVWGGLPADAKVFNLEGANNLNGPLAYLQLLKMAMHEVTGIPESALGQMQPISNTSGVALSIMYQPLMNKHAQKTTQYSQLLERVNDLALRTLALKEPYLFQWDPEMSGGTALKPGQDPVLDLTDPETYRTEIHWPAPLPLDVLVKLNELQAKMAIGLESKRGALRELGYEEPDAKMSEIFNELVEDAKEQAALDLMRTNLAIVQGMATGILPGEMMGDESGGVQSAGGSDVSSAGSGGAESVTGPNVDPAIAEALYTDIATKAYGTTIPQQSRR